MIFGNNKEYNSCLKKCGCINDQKPCNHDLQELNKENFNKSFKKQLQQWKYLKGEVK